jgi:hypothetical protein
MPLNSPARRSSPSVFWSLTSDDGRDTGRMLDALLLIPDTDDLAFYPIQSVVSKLVARVWFDSSLIARQAV